MRGCIIRYFPRQVSGAEQRVRELSQQISAIESIMSPPRRGPSGILPPPALVRMENPYVKTNGGDE